MGVYDNSDPHRSNGGQFAYMPNASVAEQAIAGVGPGDGYMTAVGKVGAQRQSMGLDPRTGFAPAQDCGAAGPFYPSRSEPVDASQIGEVLWGVIKAVILWPLAIVAPLAALACGAALIGMRVDAPTLAARAAQGDFADYQPALGSLFSERELVAPIKAAELYAAYGGYKAVRSTDANGARAHALMGGALRCVLQPGCQEAMGRIDENFGLALPREASGFFSGRVKNGDEQATRDMCLFMVKAGNSYLDLISARRLCAEANALHEGSKAGVLALAKIDESWAMRRAWIYYKLAGLQWRYEHGWLF